MPLDFSCFVRRGNAIVRLYSYTSSYSPLCRCRRERAVFGGNLSAVSAQLVIADDEGPTPVLQESSIRRVTSAPPSSPDTMTQLGDTTTQPATEKIQIRGGKAV